MRERVTPWGFSAPSVVTFLTPHTPPDFFPPNQPLPPSLKVSEVSLICMNWNSLAPCSCLAIEGFVLECLVYDDKEALQRRITGVQDIWLGCMHFEV